MKWCAIAALNILKKEDGPHLLLCDNLDSQTTPEFKAYLLEHCNCYVHNLVAGNTDEIQVVDAGFGRLIKHYANEAASEWLDNDANWKKWTSDDLAAWERRVLMTEWYGKGYEEACKTYDFKKNFEKCGSALTCDGSYDDKIHLQGVEEFTFDLADADREAATGEFAVEQVEQVEQDTNTDNEDDVNTTEGEEELEPNSDSDSDTDSGESEDPVDVGEYQPEDGWDVVRSYNPLYVVPTELINKHIAYKYTTGWCRGRVTGIERNKKRSDYGMFIVKFVDFREQYRVQLKEEDYDVDDVWVEITKK
jgi:hypothetical protein